jgi:hypothetical protein
MQVKYIVAALAAIAGAQAHAAVLNPATQTPEVTVYVTGASAQKTALAASVPAAICANAAEVVTFSDASASATGTTGWYCTSKTTLTGAANKRVLVLYRSKNGSAAGLNQLLSTTVPPTEPQAETINIGTCGAPNASNVSTCTGTSFLESTMALSDVNVSEFAAGVLNSGTGYLSPSSLTKVNVGLQGFGVVANANMYAALQQQNISEGLLPSTCTLGDASAACQPTIRSTDYASLVSLSGAIKDANGLVPNATDAGRNGMDLTVCRRVDTSGTQASSNIFFLNNVCGSAGFAGAETPIASTDGYTASPMISYETPETGDAKDCLNNKSGSTWATANPGLRIGVVSLENTPGASDEWKYVKVDGVSPNFYYDGTAWVADAKQKVQMRNGAYKFAVESYALWKGDTAQKAVANAISTNMKASTSNLTGVLSISGTGSNSALYKRANNNCGVLIKR